MLCETELYYNHGVMRWCYKGRELKAGDVIEICHNEKWERVRIEYDPSAKQYYALPCIALRDKLKVRFKCS